MYKIIKDRVTRNPCGFQSGARTSIPFDMDNADCRRVLQEWKDGPLGAVKRADGSDALYSDDEVRALGLTPLPNGPEGEAA